MGRREAENWEAHGGKKGVRRREGRQGRRLTELSKVWRKEGDRKAEEGRIADTEGDGCKDRGEAGRRREERREREWQEDAWSIKHTFNNFVSVFSSMFVSWLNWNVGGALFG